MSTHATPVNPQPTVARLAAESPFLIAWALLAVGVAALGLALQPVWAANPELADRFLIPLAAGWLIYRAVPRLKAEPRRPSAWGMVLLVPGAAAFALGWYLFVAAGSKPIVTWLLMLAIIAAIIGMATVHGGWRRASLLLFPLLFCLFALPVPGRIYRPLEQRLRVITTRAAEVALPVVGIPVTRSNFALIKADGEQLNVVDACSGIRSITALTAIAVFVAYLRGFGVGRGVLLVLLTMAVVVVCNSARVIVTALLLEHVGAWAIAGVYHDALGVAAVLAGLGLIVLLSGWIAPRGDVSQPAAVAASPAHAASPLVGIVALTTLAAALGVCLSSERWREDYHAYLRTEDFADRLGGWQGRDAAVPKEIAAELNCTQVVRRQYRNDSGLGEEVEVWVMFWADASATANLHHPDICYEFSGWERRGSRTATVTLPDGRHLSVSVRDMARRGEEQTLFFWTQHGSHVLPDGVEAGETMSGHSWILKLLSEGRKPVERGARLSVLIGTQTRGSSAAGEHILREFAPKFATDLYRVAPWAAPH